MSAIRVVIVVLWAVALAAFFVVFRPGPPPAIIYQADPAISAWVSAAAAAEAKASRVEFRPVEVGGRPTATVGRLNEGVPVAETQLVIAAWQGSPAERVASPELLTSWRDALTAGRIRFAVPGPNSPLGQDFVALARNVDRAAEADFYRGADRLRDRDDLYVEDFRNQGPGRWDAGILYEDAALQIDKQRSDQGLQPLLRIFYLDAARPVRYVADLDGPGEQLVTALVSPAGQTLALDHGIRPLDPAAASPGSLFARFASLGARPPR